MQDESLTDCKGNGGLINRKIYVLELTQIIYVRCDINFCGFLSCVCGKQVLKYKENKEKLLIRS